jgi:microcystin-dependent protein
MAEPFIGQIVLFAGNFAPRNWAFCNGQLLSIAQNTALFSILGTTYGGNGQTTFALPDLRGRVPLGTGNGPGLMPRSLGGNGGSEQVTLTSSQMAVHTHSGSISGLTSTLRGYAANNGDTNIPVANSVFSKFTGTVNANVYSDSDAGLVPMGNAPLGITVQNAGSSQGHENRQPLLALNYIIALSGVFPSRN